VANSNRGRQYEVSFRLDAELESSFRRSFGAASQSLENVERELRNIGNSNGFARVSKEARDAEKAIRDVEGDTRTFGDTLRRVAEYTGAFAVIQGVADSVKNIGATVLEFHDSMANMQAATGASVEEMEELRGIAEELYELPIGEGFQDIVESLTVVRQVTQKTGEELEDLTREAMLFRDVFGEDIRESVKAVDTMTRNFGITSTQAFNLLAQGAQRGLNKSNELLDTANEYAPQFAALGFSANEMFNIFAAGLEAGAWNLDKVGDVVKEFNIRIKDGSQTTNDALAQLFAPDDIVEWTDALMKGGKKSKQYMELLTKVSKETADQMLEDLQAGGTKMSKTFEVLQMIMGRGQEILDGLAAGALQGKDVFRMVIEQLQNVEDPLLRNQIGVALMGSQFEDLEISVVSSLGTVQEQFDMTRETMNEIEKVKLDSVKKDWISLGRQLMTDLVLPISEELLPVLERLADWAIRNKDLIEFLALATPAAMIGKNAAKVVSGFLSVSDAAEGAGKSAKNASKLMSAFRFFTNPVGIAVGAVGVLTAGVLAYREAQERARRELLNMDDALRNAFDDYGSIDEHAKRTNELINEYDRLKAVVSDSSTSAEDLAAARERLQEVEQELIELNPDILRAEDAKKENFREQLGLVQQLNETQREMARRELEQKVIQAQHDLPALQAEYEKLTKSLAEYDEAYNEAREAYVQYSQFVEQHQAIVNDSSLSYDEQLQRLQQLAEQIRELTGKDYGGNWANMMFDAQEFYESFNKNYEKWVQTQEDLRSAESSFQALYDAQLKLIEMDLGGTLEEQAKKYDDLTEAEKQRFDEALIAVDELNRKLNELPTSKKINVEVLFDQSRGITGVPESIRQQFNLPSFGSMRQYAEGGITTQPAIFGEAGPEIAIPLKESPRSRQLLDLANRLIGGDREQPVLQVTFSPNISVSGGGSGVETRVREAVRISFEEFRALMERFVREERRLSFGG